MSQSRSRNREVAKRVFAQELRDADKMFKEDDGEYAPSYMLLPSGGKANRVFICGVLSEKEERGNAYSCRVNDTTGNFILYAGQYQPEATDALRDLDVPSFVAITGKPSTFNTDEGDVISSIKPETITAVDEDTRDEWVLETAKSTIERLKRSVDSDEYVRRAEDHYGSQRMSLSSSVIDSLEQQL